MHYIKWKTSHRMNFIARKSQAHFQISIPWLVIPFFFFAATNFYSPNYFHFSDFGCQLFNATRPKLFHSNHWPSNATDLNSSSELYFGPLSRFNVCVVMRTFDSFFFVIVEFSFLPSSISPLCSVLCVHVLCTVRLFFSSFLSLSYFSFLAQWAKLYNNLEIMLL